MAFNFVVFGIMMAISLVLTGLQILLRPKQQKGDVFDSKTYQLQGMENSIEVGTPVNVVYGEHKISPHILNYQVIARGESSKIEAVLSLGEGVIAGIRDIEVNDQGIDNLFANDDDYDYWVTHGESVQKVYNKCHKIKAKLKETVSPGANVTIKCTLDKDVTKEDRDFQAATSNEPGYFTVYNWEDGNEDAHDIDSYEIIKYTGKTNVSNTERWLTGCLVTKSHTGLAASIKQIYKIYHDDLGNVPQVIPGLNKTVVNHQDVSTQVNHNDPLTKTTINKVEAVSIVIGFPSGLYAFDDKDGYKDTSVNVRFTWWMDGTSWSDTTEWVTKTRTKTADTGYYIKLKNGKNYGYCVDAGGNYTEGTVEELEDTEWNKIRAGDIIKITTDMDYELKVKLAPELEPIPSDEYTSDGYPIEKFRYKITFKQIVPAASKTYTGPKATNASYEVVYEAKESNAVLETTISPGKPILSDYRYSWVLPNLKEFGKLDYAKYKYKVEKLTPEFSSADKGANDMIWVELQEITIDALAYPHEGLLAVELNANEKISGTISNISCIVHGRTLKDVQNTGGPDRASANPYDIFADIITNKRYGRGRDINMSASDLTAFYTAHAPEAAYCDQVITEPDEDGVDKTHKRFEINANIDFRKPTIDLIQSLGVCFRGNTYWDGVKPICYTDRTASPTAMFGPVNAVPGSVGVRTLNLSDYVNRIYSQFLNKDKDYTHDSVSHDFRDEGFTASKLRQKEISLYGITDAWHAAKVDAYLLRLAKYAKNTVSFKTGGDAITVNMGEIFYWCNKNANTGRIIAVGANNITLDKPFTINNGVTYKALLRKDDGTVIERTVDNTATGLGSKTLIYFTWAISSVSVNAIYGIGVSGLYYDLYRLVKKEINGGEYDLAGLLYDPGIYSIYLNDPYDAPGTKIKKFKKTSSFIRENPSVVPPNVKSLIVREDPKNIGTVYIFVLRPNSGTSWSHCEIYIKEDLEGIEQFVGTSYGSPLKVSNLKLDVDYTVKVVSSSRYKVPNPHPYIASMLLDGSGFATGTGLNTGELPKVTGLRIKNMFGDVNNYYGRDFEFVWDDMAGNLSDTIVKKTNSYEETRYLIRVYYSGIPDSVKLNGEKVNSIIAYEQIKRENAFAFTLENNIEAISRMYENYATDPNYTTYYGNPERQITVMVWLLNSFGMQSVAPAEITVINPPPDFKDFSGIIIVPELYPLKSCVRIKWAHPNDYDITNFIVKLQPINQWAPNIVRSVGDWISPTTPNNKAFRCSVAGTSGSSEPDWASQLNMDGSAQWTLDTANVFQSTAMRFNVPSIINVDSSSADVLASKYKVEIDSLDPKLIYFIKILPYDAYGLGTESSIFSIGPGLTFDDLATFISMPGVPTNVALTVIGTTTIKVSWTPPIDIDIDGYYVQWRGVLDTSASIQPSAAEVNQGYKNGDTSKIVMGEVVSTSIDGETGSKNWITVRGAKRGYKYFARVRTQNTSDQKGLWSHADDGVEGWPTHAVPVVGIDEQDIANNAVAARAIIEKAVTTGKLDDYAVDGIKIKNAAVDAGQKLVNNSITEAKYGLASIPTGALKDAIISSGILQDYSVTELKYGLTSIPTGAVKDSAVTAVKVYDNYIKIDETAGHEVSTDLDKDQFDNYTLGGNIAAHTYDIATKYYNTVSSASLKNMHAFLQFIEGGGGSVNRSILANTPRLITSGSAKAFDYFEVKHVPDAGDGKRLMIRRVIVNISANNFAYADIPTMTGNQIRWMLLSPAK